MGLEPRALSPFEANRLRFVDERLHPTALIVAAEEGGEGLGFELATSREIGLFAAEDQRGLAAAMAMVRVKRSSAAALACARHEIGGGHDDVHETDRQGLLRRDDVTRVDELARTGDADAASEALRGR